MRSRVIFKMLSRFNEQEYIEFIITKDHEISHLKKRASLLVNKFNVKFSNKDTDVFDEEFFLQLYL